MKGAAPAILRERQEARYAGRRRCRAHRRRRDLRGRRLHSKTRITVSPIAARPGPIDRSFWVAPGRLLAGAHPVDLAPGRELGRLDALLSAGMRTFIDLTHPDDVAPGGRKLGPYAALLASAAHAADLAAYVRMPLLDERAPPFDLVQQVLDRIDAELALPRVVYVHCWAGRGRTGSIVGCWLERHGIASGEGVLQALRTLRHRDGALPLPCPAEEDQRQLVRGWQQGR